MDISRMVARLARLGDARILFEWRNDPVTRQASLSTDEIKFENHLCWLKKSLQNPARRIYISSIGTQNVGSVRIDRSSCSWNLSWTVAPNWRGKGVGKIMVSNVVKSLSLPVTAEIRVNNIPSIKIAEAAGLQLVQEIDGIRHYASGDGGS